jgi:hypothetical protein
MKVELYCNGEHHFPSNGVQATAVGVDGDIAFLVCADCERELRDEEPNILVLEALDPVWKSAGDLVPGDVVALYGPRWMSVKLLDRTYSESDRHVHLEFRGYFKDDASNKARWTRSTPTLVVAHEENYGGHR